MGRAVDDPTLLMFVESSNFERRATEDPHLIVWSGEPIGVQGFLVVELAAMHVRPQVVMIFGQCFCRGMRLLIFCLVGYRG